MKKAKKLYKRKIPKFIIGIVSLMIIALTLKLGSEYYQFDQESKFNPLPTYNVNFEGQPTANWILSISNTKAFPIRDIYTNSEPIKLFYPSKETTEILPIFSLDKLEVSPNFFYSAYIEPKTENLMLLSHEDKTVNKINQFGCVKDILGWTPDGSKIYFYSPFVDKIYNDGWGHRQNCLNTTETGIIIFDIFTGKRKIINAPPSDVPPFDTKILNYPFGLSTEDKGVVLKDLSRISSASAKISTHIEPLLPLTQNSQIEIIQISFSNDLKRASYLEIDRFPKKESAAGFGRYSIYYINIITKSRTKIYEGSKQNPIISPDGRYVAYENAIYDSKTAKTIKSKDKPQFWIDDSTIIMQENNSTMTGLKNNNKIYMVNAATGDLTEIN